MTTTNSDILNDSLTLFRNQLEFNMNQAIQDDTPFEWAPYVLTDVDTTTKERTGYIGRAIALRQNGMEFIVMAKTEEDVNLVTQNFLGIAIDESRVYKATMISSEGVAVDMDRVPPVVPEEPIVPVVPEVPVTPVAEEDDEL